jgi:uncharacterized damage-inducible protein DinB
MEEQRVKQLIETWQIHNRIHIYLLDALSEEALAVSIAPRRRTVFQLFAHIHSVRLMWLKETAPDLLTKVPKIENKSGDKATLVAALTASHESHHRGQIEWTLRASDYTLDDKISYGLWEWGVR